MKVIRYSLAFKLQAVREVESGELCAQQVQRKYGIADGAGKDLTGVNGCVELVERLPIQGELVSGFELQVFPPLDKCKYYIILCNNSQ